MALAGCGGGSGAGARVAPGRVPVIAGARIVEQTRQCDRGANAFCALELVVVDRGLSSAGALVTREHDLLRHSGWRDASGDFGQEQAADSPGHRLHVTYATALADLTGIDEGWIKRPRSLSVVLSRELFARTPAMALTLQTGPA